MLKWTSRICSYKFCSILSYLAFLMYAIAFSVPMWLHSASFNFIGLWMYGNGSDHEIDSYKSSFFDEGPIDTAWFEAVRALMLVGMCCYVIAVMVSLVENCCVSHVAKDFGVSGAFTLLAGLCGTAAVIVTAIKVEDSRTVSGYGWCFILAAVASGLAIILSLVLIITRNAGILDDRKLSRTADYVYAHNNSNKHMPYGPTYNNPGYRNDEHMGNGLQSYQPPSAPYGTQNPYNMYRTDTTAFNTNKTAADQGPNNYYPYAYRETARAGNRASIAESADLSNGFVSNGMVQQPRGEFYYNGGGSRPY